MTESAIPVIDLHALLSAEPTAEQLAPLRAAIERIGIIQVVNHGVPADLVTDFHRRIDQILALPRAEKAELASPTGHPYRGWRQWPDDFGRLELERYSIGQFDTARDARAAGLTEEQAELYDHPNVWPPHDPGLREVALRYHDELVRLARRILDLYATAIGASAGTFPLGDREHTTFVINDYPTWTHPDGASDEDKLLLLEHADGSAVTILHQQGDYAGLQGQLPDGSWTPVPIIPGALQVFSGMLLSRWTDGLLAAGRHRVVSGGAVTRRSSAVFVHPSLDAVVEPLERFVGPDGPEFEPLYVWDEVRDRVERYLQDFGRPEQVAAWREGRPYVAAVTEQAGSRG